MAVVAHVILRGVSREQCDAVRAKPGIAVAPEVASHPAHEVDAPEALRLN